MFSIVIVSRKLISRRFHEFYLYQQCIYYVLIVVKRFCALLSSITSGAISFFYARIVWYFHHRYLGMTKSGKVVDEFQCGMGVMYSCILVVKRKQKYRRSVRCSLCPR